MGRFHFDNVSRSCINLTTSGNHAHSKRLRIADALIAAVIGMLASTQTVHADTDIWKGGSGNWSTPANWSNGVPINIDVSIDGSNPATSAVTLSDNAVINGLTIQAGDSLTLGAGTLSVNGNSSIDGTLTFASTSALSIDVPSTFSGSGQVLFGLASGTFIKGAGPLTIAPGLSIRTGTQQGFLAFPVATVNVDSLTNQGLISANTTNYTVNINSASFTNTGTVQAANGTLAINSTNWSNSGTLAVSGSGVLKLGGQFTTSGMGTISRSGGTIELTGTLDNSNSMLSLNAATGSIKIRGGTLSGGTVSAKDGTSLGIAASSSATLDNVILDSDLIAEGSTSISLPTTLNVSNTLSIVNGHTLSFPGGGMIAGSGQILFAGDGAAGNISAGLEGISGLVIGPTVSIRTAGQGGVILNPVQNKGLISSETAGKSIKIIGLGMYSTGTLRAHGGGALDLPGINSGGRDGTIIVDAFSSLTTTQMIYESLTLGGNAGDPASFAHVTLRPGHDSTQLNALNFQTDAANHPLGVLDIGNSVVALDYAAGAPSPLNSIRADILTARAGGNWDGPGITSSLIPANPNYGIGFAESSDVVGPSKIFAGMGILGNAVLMRYTLLGDTNLDGAVNFTDLVKLAQHYGISDGSATWSQGDVNYDGNVDFADLVALAQNYGGALAADALAAGIALPGTGTAVPEPGMGASVLAAALFGARRRRRRLATQG